MGDLSDPIDGGTLVPYFWPYELWGYSLKHRPDIYIYIYIYIYI